MKDSPKTNRQELEKMSDLKHEGEFEQGRGPGSDSRIKNRSSIDRRPKMVATKKTGVNDIGSMKQGSALDDESHSESLPIDKKSLQNGLGSAD